MQVSVEDLSPVKKKLTIEVPQAQVAEEVDVAYNELKKNAKVKGFRPGKVPRNVLVRRFSKDVHADVASKLIQASFFEAIKDKDLKMVGNPDIDSPELDSQGDYQYTATIEVQPEIGTIDFTGLELKKTLHQASDGEIEAQLKMIQRNLTKSEPIDEERAVQDGDVALIDYEGFKDGNPFADTALTKNFAAKVGDNTIAEAFDQGLIGMNAGEQKDIEVSFPQDYRNPKLAGHTINFAVTLNEIRQEVIPPIDDAFATKVGEFADLQALKDEIRKNLDAGYAKRIEQELNEQAFKALLERTSFEVPDAMVDYELEGIMDEAERSFAYHQKSMEDLGLTREGLSEKYRPTAEKQVRRHLILNQIIKQEELELSDEEIDAGFADLAEKTGQPQKDIQEYYEQFEDKLTFFKHTLLEKKAIALILEASKIEEVAPNAETDEPEAAEN